MCGAEGYLPRSTDGSSDSDSEHGDSSRSVNFPIPVNSDSNTLLPSPGEQKPFIRNVYTLNTCSNIVGSQVLSFDDEDEMLQSWRDFVQEVDPDVVIGYNIAGFDFPYLIDRAKALKANRFPYLGRLKSNFISILLFSIINSHITYTRHQNGDQKYTLLIQGFRPAGFKRHPLGWSAPA